MSLRLFHLKSTIFSTFFRVYCTKRAEILVHLVSGDVRSSVSRGQRVFIANPRRGFVDAVKSIKNGEIIFAKKVMEFLVVK